MLLLRRSVTVEGDSGEAVNLELWSGMLLVSEHASSSSYERPLKEDGMLTTTPRTTISPLFSLASPGLALAAESAVFGSVLVLKIFPHSPK